MKARLSRVLRIRALLEEMSQAEREVRALELRQAEEAARGQRQLAAAAQSEAIGLLLAPSPGPERGAGRQDWRTVIADGDLFRWKMDKLSILAEARRPAVEHAREELMERRRERLQVESLLTTAASRECQANTRREQRLLDEWFQGQNRQRRRGMRLL